MMTFPSGESKWEPPTARRKRRCRKLCPVWPALSRWVPITRVSVTISPRAETFKPSRHALMRGWLQSDSKWNKSTGVTPHRALVRSVVRNVDFEQKESGRHDSCPCAGPCEWS
jgi:hypothetical protein